MKKALSIILCVVLAVSCAFSFSACSKQQNLKYDVVLITDGADINDSGYNQSAWQGIESYCESNNLSCRYYKPILEDNQLTVDNVEKYVELSAENKAEYIVMTGESFSAAAYELAPVYPDIKFILLDAMPHSQGSKVHSFLSNVMSVSFDAAQSGFLAGCIAVLNGDTKLGYFGQAGSDDSANYGAGFVQGAAYAADALAIPVTVDWADYDSPLLNYDYSVTVKACYEKIKDQKETTYKVNVVDGVGSGTYTQGSNVTVTANPAPKGKEFDHWEVKSNTDGVKDKKVNISSKSKPSMNLLVGDCDCTITAVYKNSDSKFFDVKVMTQDGKDVYSAVSVKENSTCEVKAPAAQLGMTFERWQTNAKDAVENAESAVTNVNVTDKEIVLTPVYKTSETPTFNVNVVTGDGGNGESSGSGSYLPGDKVEIAAAVPKEEYMFSHWENVDANGNHVGLSMENEFYWNTSFEMADRYADVCSAMFNKGDTLVFAGGNDKVSSAFDAKGNYHYNLKLMTAGTENSDAYCAIVKNYGEAVKDCLDQFTGGGVVSANCSTDGIYASFVSDDEKIKEQYDDIYKALAEGRIPLVGAQGGAGYDFCKKFNEEKMSKCLTLNGWFLEGIEIPKK